jgi:hypothetical protein
MSLSTQQKFVILVLAVALLLYFMNKDNDNYTTVSNTVAESENVPQEQNDSHISSALDQLVSTEEQEVSDIKELSSIEKKMLGKNSVNGANVKVSYSTDSRPSNRTDKVLDDFFERGNSITNVASDNERFEPLDDTNKGGDSYAPVSLGKARKQTAKDIYNLDNFLPKQVNEDWFDNVPEPISVKNRYLINISKQVGVNTIGSSHKNASWDLRGEVYCPKFVVSPWMQSSIEPDTSLVGLCGKDQ